MKRTERTWNIQVIEDQGRLHTTLKQYLSIKDYAVHAVDNRQIHIFDHIESKADIVVFDPYSFEGFTYSLIEKLLKHPNPPITVAMSDNRNPEEIIKLVKLGVYDYILLDRDFEEIVHKIKKACDASELNRLRKSHERQLGIVNGYFAVKNTRGKYRLRTQESAFLSSLRTSFSQGTGIGTMTTILSIIQNRAIEETGYVKIDKQLYSTLMDNYVQIKNLIKVFENLENLENENPELVCVPVNDLYEVIKSEIEKVSPFSSARKKTISINEAMDWKNQCIQIVPEYFKQAIYELLINAIKFSLPKSPIMVMVQYRNDGLTVAVVNQPEKNAFGTYEIPEEYQELIFEPFFRLSRLLFEDIPTPDFGLGLSLVNLLIKKMKGSITVSNLESYMSVSFGGDPQKLVSMEIWMPVFSAG